MNTTVEQRLRNTQEKLAFLRSKENIQSVIKENPGQLRHLVIEEEVLKSLIVSRKRKVEATLNAGFNLFALFLFSFVTITAICLFNYTNFAHFTWKQQLSELAMQLGLITMSVLTFFLFLSHSRARAKAVVARKILKN